MPQRRAAAIGTAAQICRLVATCRDGLTGTRDRALLLMGFAAARRRGELVAVQRDQLTFTAEGLWLLIPCAKAEQGGRGVELGLSRGKRPDTHPVRASNCAFGPVFRKINRWGKVESAALQPYALPKILARRLALAGSQVRRHRAAVAPRPARRLHHRGLRGRGTGRGHYGALLAAGIASERIYEDTCTSMAAAHSLWSPELRCFASNRCTYKANSLTMLDRSMRPHLQPLRSPRRRPTPSLHETGSP